MFKCSFAITMTSVMLILAAASYAVDITSRGAVHMGSMENYGALTPNSYVEYDSGEHTEISGSTSPGNTLHRGGSTFGGLYNETGNSVTMNVAALLNFNVDGTTSHSGADSTASISIGSDTATGNCNGLYGSYGPGGNTNKYHSFAPVTLLNGQALTNSGSWSIDLKGS